MKDLTKKYTNGEITVVWKPALCVHSGLCFRGLGSVFNPRARPWVTPEGGTTEQIAEQVKKCPSGALSSFMNAEAAGGAAGGAESEVDVEAETVVEPTPNGPLLVYGNVVVKNSRGELMRKHNVTAFCRCGASANKPFCDGSHTRTGFKAE
jgi:uncharacterized Fe-S cluster protein YjdI